MKKKNQVWQLLPLKEEAGQWEKQNKTLILEFRGLKEMFQEEVEKEVILISILERLHGLKEEEDFFLFRKTIFDTITLIESLEVKK